MLNGCLRNQVHLRNGKRREILGMTRKATISLGRTALAWPVKKGLYDLVCSICRIMLNYVDIMFYYFLLLCFIQVVALDRLLCKPQFDVFEDWKQDNWKKEAWQTPEASVAFAST